MADQAERPDDGRGIARLADELLPALVARFEASGLGELEVRREGWRVRLKRAAGPAGALAAPPASSSASAGPALAGPSGNGSHAPHAAHGPKLAAVGPGKAAASGDHGQRRVAASPAVGYFAPLEATAPGRVVRAGDVLGHVDVLGVRQEVVAPLDGVVTRLLAQPGEAVEYGQELVRVGPGGSAGSGGSGGSGSGGSGASGSQAGEA